MTPSVIPNIILNVLCININNINININNIKCVLDVFAYRLATDIFFWQLGSSFTTYFEKRPIQFYLKHCKRTGRIALLTGISSTKGY